MGRSSSSNPPFRRRPPRSRSRAPRRPKPSPSPSPPPASTTSPSTPPAASSSSSFSQSTLLLLLFLLDTVSVSILIPFLPQFYTLLPLSTSHRELLSSVYNLSQIVGGAIVGGMSDKGGKKYWLLASFLGSFLSYSCVSSVPTVLHRSVNLAMYMMVFSRVLVGLLKQTQTITTSLISQNTEGNMLRGELGKLSACITTGWIIGPAIGSTIVSNYGLDAAPKVSAGIFALNSLVGWIADKLGYYSSYGSVISLVTNLGVLDRAINGARRVLKIKGAKDR
ncbi:hypothetical protein TrCOL_g9378 [Triparma columacea]|uniref:Major facilitator superfamily (MFS) profile domain-containing protein n=1 Tax=Triparma columacea TaxID=722753 RepID=A0A9W7GDM7_9STRA|nr:hypothetical protein TrCOL_g9378 [Triparma columacea]